MTPNDPVTSTTRIRTAVLGAGLMAQHHARALQRLPELVDLVGFTDPNPAAREAFAAAIPGVPGFDGLAALLAAQQVDAVHVCTPFQTHEQLALEALDRNCHIYVEKPFATSLGATARVLDRAAGRGRLVCAGHQLLYEPPARRMKELLHGIGSPIHVESYFSFRPAKSAGPGRAPRRADEQLFDILPHPVYLLLEFMSGGRFGDRRAEISRIEIGPGATIHALVRVGNVTGTLVVTLDGRPVESYLRIVGTNGSLSADFVRGTVQRLIGPGSSGVDKLLAPYRLASQLLLDTTSALGARFLKRQRSYPGLVEIFEAFHTAVRDGGPSPLSPASIRATAEICEQVAAEIGRTYRAPDPVTGAAASDVTLITGGTGFLGQALTACLLEQGRAVRVTARRSPAPWQRIEGVEYVTCDLARELPDDALRGVTRIVHCAAETAGGWDAHQANSIDATRVVMQAAARHGVARVLHVSSMGVLGPAPGGGAIDEDSPLEPDNRSRGPYVWGKTESERLLAEFSGLPLGVPRIVRPGALVDYRELDPPGALGRRLGNLFVAVGWPSQRLGVVDVQFAARVIAHLLDHYESAPPVLNLLSPNLPARKELLARLRSANPGLRVLWLPPPVLHPLSWVAVLAQKILRPKAPAVSLARVFASKKFDTRRIAAVETEMRTSAAVVSETAQTR